jgi:hypothetical protein
MVGLTFTLTMTVAVLVAEVAPPPTLTETVASLFVVRVEVALPPTSVDATAVLNVPAVDENVTAISRSGFPAVSTTTAVIVLDPPLAATVDGDAVTVTRPAAAAPTVIFTPGFAVSAGFAPPDVARISATPELPVG